MSIKYGIIGAVEDCASSNNKCKECTQKDRCDFDYVYRLHGKNSDLLGPCMPASLKESFRRNEIILNDEYLGFCDFHVCKKAEHVTVYHICTVPEARGKGLAKQFVNYLIETYKLPVQAVCISDSPSEAFWSRVGIKAGDKVSRKGTKLSIYRVGDTKPRAVKEVLF